MTTAEREALNKEKLPREVGRASLEIYPGLVIEVVNLDNGQRVITEETMESFLNWLQEGNTVEGR